MDQEEKCCVCQELINYARGIKLLESSCKHKLQFFKNSCEKCKNKLFQKRNDQDCPICRKKLYKNEFKEKLIDEIEFENDLKYRKEVIKQIGRNENTFQSLEEYDDYLEEIEFIIDKLKSGTQKQQEEAYKKIEFFKEKIKQIQQNEQTINYETKKIIKLPKPIPLNQLTRTCDPINKFKASGTSPFLHVQKGLQELIHFQTIF